MADEHALPPPPPLAEFEAQGPVALFLDFDGTLVDIAQTPDTIRVPQTLAARLEALAGRLHGRVALVSGRALDDLEGHLGSIGLCRAGSHGADCLRVDGSPVGVLPRALPDGVVEQMRDFASRRGIDFEAKRHGGALHYRRNPDAAEDARAFVTEIARSEDFAVKSGKAVFELVRDNADKGSALRAFMGEAGFAGATPLFVGDDLTDEDGFEAAAALGGLGIIVGDRLPTTARFRLSDVEEVYSWLKL